MSDIEDKIRKLLALAQSANENEAALAAEKAAELALKHNIDLLEFQTQPPEYIDDQMYTSKKNELWVMKIMQSVAKLNACKFYYISYRGTCKYRLVGRPQQIRMATEIGQYLLTTVKRLNTEAWQASGLDPSIRKDYRKSFRIGCASRLEQRLLQRLADLKHKNNTIPNTKALVVMNYFVAEQKAIDQHMEDIGLELGTGRSRSVGIKSHDGYADGSRAGDRIGLDTQIATPDLPRRLA